MFRAKNDRKLNRHRTRECCYCGKLNGSHMRQHFKRNHKGMAFSCVEEGSYAKSYYWASEQTFAIELLSKAGGKRAHSFELN